MLLGHGNKRIAAITDLMADTVKKIQISSDGQNAGRQLG
jgi:hypothetical protein